MNDPNAPILWRGQYHLFYQHNPNAPVWGDIHWGHAVSDDLAHWSDRGIALSPTPGTADADGCWSGCARVIDGHPTIFYTGLSINGGDWDQSVCRAVGSAELGSFAKDPSNPIIPASIRPIGHLQHRDPFVFRDELRDRWVMIQGTGIETDDYAGGAVVLYDSADAHTWTYQGILFTLPDHTGTVDTGPVWECPALFESDGVWVLLLSVQLPIDRGVGTCPYSLWFSGSFDGESFSADRRGMLDHGDTFYAPALLAHPDGRQLMWGWVQESATQEVLTQVGSAGALSLPREVHLLDGGVVTRFARELEVLWEPGLSVADITLAMGDVVPLSDLGPCWRIRGSATSTGVGIRLGWDDKEEVVLVADPQALKLRRGELMLGEVPASGSEVGFDLILDGTILEVHTSSGAAMTTRLMHAHRRDIAILGGDDGGMMRGILLQACRREPNDSRTTTYVQ